MGRKAKVTDNVLVANWLIRNRWMNSLTTDARQRLPGFVDDAVWAAIAIVAGQSDGTLNINPKLVMKALMLKSISTEEVKRLEVGYDMSDRQAQRLAQTTRFALDGIRHRIQEYENTIPEETKMLFRMEKSFVDAYYSGTPSPLYSEPLEELPEEISLLREQSKYVEYALRVKEFRTNN